MVVTASKANVPASLATEVNNVKKKCVSTTALIEGCVKTTVVCVTVDSVDSTVHTKSV